MGIEVEPSVAGHPEARSVNALLDAKGGGLEVAVEPVSFFCGADGFQF